MKTADCYKGSKMPHKPTDNNRAIVRKMYAAGVKQDSIAKYLDISDETLRKYYRDDLDKAFDELVTDIANVLILKAKDGDIKSIIFFLTHRGGWKQASDIDAKSNADSLTDLIVAGLNANKS